MRGWKCGGNSRLFLLSERINTLKLKLSEKSHAPDQASTEFKIKAEWIALGLLAFLFLLVSSCGPKDVDKMGEAQACLNEATADQVDGCLEKISGVNSVGADTLRCAGYFQREGILTTSTLIQAFSDLNEEGGSNADRFGGFMSLVTFTKSAPSWTTAESRALSTFDMCVQSQGKATTFIAAFSVISNAILSYGFQAGETINYGTAAQIATSLTDSIAELALDLLEPPVPGAVAGVTPPAITALTNIGTVIIKSYQVSCTVQNPIDSTTCTQFDQAIDNAGPGATPQRVAEEFLEILVS